MFTRLIAATVAVLTLSACASGGSTDVLAENLRAHEEAQQALRERISELESRLDEQSAPDASPQLESLSTRLSEVSAAMEALRQEFDQRLEGDEAADTTLQAELTELSEQLDLLAETLSGVSADVTSLDAGLADLRETVDQHLQSHDQ